jgi:hypothetical protein
VELHHFDAVPTPEKNFDAAPAPNLQYIEFGAIGAGVGSTSRNGSGSLFLCSRPESVSELQRFSLSEIGRSENGRLWRMVLWRMVTSGDWSFGDWSFGEWSPLENGRLENGRLRILVVRRLVVRRLVIRRIVVRRMDGVPSYCTVNAAAAKSRILSNLGLKFHTYDRVHLSRFDSVLEVMGFGLRFRNLLCTLCTSKAAAYFHQSWACKVLSVTKLLL